MKAPAAVKKKAQNWKVEINKGAPSMKIKTHYFNTNPKDTLFKRLRCIFWTSSLFVSFFTFFAPMLNRSSARYAMVDVEAVNGYELIACTPVLALFVISAPILYAILHTAELPEKKKILMYYALGILYILALGACLILNAIEILTVENCLVRFAGGAYFVAIANFVSLSVGVIPTIWMIEDEE